MNAYDALGHRTHPGELRAARAELKRRGYSSTGDARRFGR